MQKTRTQVKELRDRGVHVEIEKKTPARRKPKVKAVKNRHTTRPQPRTRMKKTGGYVFSVADARKGGQKGGLARKKVLTKAQRRAIAQKAARARWTRQARE